MPNHVTNKLIVVGKPQDVAYILDYITRTNPIKPNPGTVNFNKITPMPKWVFTGDLRTSDEEKYGKENCWYGWSLKNWGTKWNAYGFHDPRNTQNTVFFQTAWSTVVDLMRKLSLMFPEVLLNFAWADEDVGQNVGRAFMQNGVILLTRIPPEGSPEARRLFFEITQDDIQDYGIDSNYNIID